MTKAAVLLKTVFIFTLLFTLFSTFVLILKKPKYVYSETVSHIVISEVQIAGEGTGNAGNDFIELYNPSGIAYDLNGHRLVKRTSGGTTDSPIKSWTEETLIPPQGYYLWANSTWTPSVTPNTSTTATIAADNGIALRLGANDTGELIDYVAWGDANNDYVGLASFPSNPDPGKSIERKACSTSTADTMTNADSANGNSEDTNNSSNDFILKEVPDPQNLSSDTEAPGCSGTPTQQPSITPTQEITPTLEPTPTLTVTPTAEPTATLTPIIEPTPSEEPTPTLEPTASPTPSPKGQVIGLFNFPGKTTVCKLTFAKVRFFWSFFLVPQITCVNT